ncbi:unnamed protein product [Closterium sp. NIES-64]|nr:unnamed protein product [Closterium sp. NIES-64]
MLFCEPYPFPLPTHRTHQRRPLSLLSSAFTTAPATTCHVTTRSWSRDAQSLKDPRALLITSSVSVAASGRTSLLQGGRRGAERRRWARAGARGRAGRAGRGRAAEQSSAGCEWSGVGRGIGMAEAADYVVPAIAITAATALTFIAVSFNELREKSAVQQELKQQARLAGQEEGLLSHYAACCAARRRRLIAVHCSEAGLEKTRFASFDLLSKLIHLATVMVTLLPASMVSSERFLQCISVYVQNCHHLFNSFLPQ